MGTFAGICHIGPLPCQYTCSCLQFTNTQVMCCTSWAPYLGSLWHPCASTVVAAAWCSKLVVTVRNNPHNFQHWMPWLGWRWRVQRSVISMLNSRISWIIRTLNTHCAFGVFLKACLLQCLVSWHQQSVVAQPCLVAACFLCQLTICFWHMQCIVYQPVTRMRLDVLETFAACDTWQSCHSNA